MVFDDKQRIIIDNEVNGDFGVDFPIGHQIFGPERFRISFQNNTGLALLQTGVEVVGLNTGARANVLMLLLIKLQVLVHMFLVLLMYK